MNPRLGRKWHKIKANTSCPLKSDAAFHDRQNERDFYQRHSPGDEGSPEQPNPYGWRGSKISFTIDSLTDISMI
jgi:hypothetical protein